MLNVFENPWLLVIVSVVFLAAMVLYRKSHPEKAAWWQLFLPIILLAVAIGLDVLVKTDLEKVNRTLKQATIAIESHDADRLTEFILQEYSDRVNHSKTQLIEYCRYFLSPRGVGGARL